MAQSVWQIVAANAGTKAIGAPGRPWLDGAGLNALVTTTRDTLNAAGIGRGDRVAIVLPNGPEMATCFVAVAASVTAAPLNPAYKSDEFEFYLSDLKPAALIMADGDESPARIVAARLGIPVINLFAQPGPAGSFRLDASLLPPVQAARPGPAEPGPRAAALEAWTTIGGTRPAARCLR